MHKFFELIKLDVWSYPEADSSYTRMNRLIIGRWIGSRENGGKHPCCKLRRLLYMATETLLSTKTSMHRTKFIQVLRANTGMFARVTEDAPYTIQTSERTWLSLSCIFAELGLWSRQKFMHALSEAAKMPSITRHVEIKRGVNIANQLRHQSIDAVT